MDTLTAALNYRAAGLAPLPLHGVSKDGQFCHCKHGARCKPGTRGKHPQHEDWATKDFPTEEEIRSWFAKRPASNIGIRTGKISGIFVLDIDTGGFEEMREIVREGGGMPETTVIQTGSGYWHYYFQYPEGLEITNSSGSLPKGVDIRGDGGQVVAPPSRTGKGDYVVFHSAPIAPAPQWLLDRITDKGREVEFIPAATEKRPQSADESAYEQNMLQKQLGRLAALQNKPWEPGDAWDQNCFEVACHLVELANSEWAAITLQEARASFMAAAPTDDQWDEREAKWTQALRTAGNKSKQGPANSVGVVEAMSADPTQGQGLPPATARIVEETSDKVVGQSAAGTDSSVIADFCNESLLHRYYYTDESGWFSWDGRVWAQTPPVALEERFRRWCSDKVYEASKNGDDNARKFYANRLSTGKIESIPKRCRGAMLVKIDVFDQHPDLLTVKNGIVNLSNGTLIPHDPAYMMTRITEVEYHPNARHEDWDIALTAMPPAVVDWMQLRVGQGATGYPTWDDLLPIMQGGGENGKTTFMAGIQHAMGSYAGVINEKVLLGRASDHSTEITDLRGMRLAIIEETSQDGVLNVKRLKDVLGTTTIRARRIRENTMEWSPTHSLFLTTNYPPKVAETDHGTWRRLALVRFPYRFVKDGLPLRAAADRRGDQNLRSRLEAGLQGQHQAILSWIVAGAVRWYTMNKGVAPLPEEVIADTATWRAETDRVHGFLSERVEFDPAGKILSSDLYEEFSAYLNRSGAQPWAENTLATRLREHPTLQSHGVTKRRTAALDGLSRPGEVWQEFAAGQQAMVWYGMKFQPKAERASAVVAHMQDWR